LDTLATLIETVVRALAVTPTMILIGVLLFVLVMSRNYRRLRLEQIVIPWQQGETTIDRIDVQFPLVTIRTVLTNKRIIQLRLSWFLSKRKLKVLALEDAHSLVLRRYANWLLFLAGVYTMGSFNPLALLLILAGLQAKVYSIRLDTPFAQMPYTRMVVSTVRRSQLTDLLRFYSRCQVAWAGRRQRHSASASSDTTVPEPDQDFVWGPALVAVAVFLGAAFVQRAVEAHVSLDSYLFAPLYLGAIAGLAAISARDSAWLAVLGMCALFTVKFPSGGLISLLTSDGTVPYLEQYVRLALGLLLVAGAAWAISRYLHPLGAWLGLLVWIPVVAFESAAAAQDFGLYARLFLAMAVAAGLPLVLRGVQWIRGRRRAQDPPALLGQDLEPSPRS
jgi:hypothetical protein